MIALLPYAGDPVLAQAKRCVRRDRLVLAERHAGSARKDLIDALGLVDLRVP